MELKAGTLLTQLYFFYSVTVSQSARKIQLRLNYKYKSLHSELFKMLLPPNVGSV